MNPLADSAPLDADDAGLVARARGGSRDALEQLIRRHERWIYNIVRRMTYGRPDAEDATQEILIKVITKLATFEEKSSFRTWLYRIVVNHVLNMKRSRSEEGGWSFERYGAALAATPDSDIVDAVSAPADHQVLVEEKALCTSGMLLCLDREQRLIYRDHPFHESPDFVGRMRALLAEGRFTFPLELP